jgi:hypothetical protein
MIGVRAVTASGGAEAEVLMCLTKQKASILLPRARIAEAGPGGRSRGLLMRR